MFRELLREAKGDQVLGRRRLLLACKFMWLKFIWADHYWSKLMHVLGEVPNKEGFILRRVFYKKYFKHLGSGVKISPNVKFFFPEKIVLGERVGINENCYLNGHSGIEIDDRTLVGPYTIIHSANHNIPESKGKIIDAGFLGKQVTIGKDVLISAHCCVLAGIRINEGSVIGAGSVVTKDVPEYCVYAGSPAKEIRKRS